jgi:hypothetical protein
MRWKASGIRSDDEAAGRPAECQNRGMRFARIVPLGALLLAAAELPGCGSGNNSSSSSPASPTPVQVSVSSPFGNSATSCGVTVPSGTPAPETYGYGAGIQPQVAAVSGSTAVAVWEQDRWSGLGSRGILTARSSDGGATWSTPTALQFSACGGGTGPGAAFDRASDPWLASAGGGVMIATALAFSANGFVQNSFLSTGGSSAVLVARSTDGGVTWSPATALIDDTNPGPTVYFNDRDSVTSDGAGNVYVVWDRLVGTVNGAVTAGPAYLATSTDSGQTWSAKVLYDPGTGNQTLNNQIVILPSGLLLDFFTLISLSTGGATLSVISSSDKGATWSAPVAVGTIVSNGVPNPATGGAPYIRTSPLLAQVAVDPASGAVAAVWQQAFGSATFDGVALSVSTNSGSSWSSATQINGSASVAAFSPTVRYLAGSVLAVTYYDLRDFMSGSMALDTDAWLTESGDGGKTWHEVRIQGPFDLSLAPLAYYGPVGFGATGFFLGDNQGLALMGSSPLPVYAATNGSGGHVYAIQPPDPLTLSSAHVYDELR